MNRTVRAASDADGVVDQMRQLVQRPKPAAQLEDRDQVERIVSMRIATVLMVLLTMIIFVTSAVPDVGPSLAKVIEAHL
jgi:hypothetical protein